MDELIKMLSKELKAQELAVFSVKISPFTVEGRGILKVNMVEYLEEKFGIKEEEIRDIFKQVEDELVKGCVELNNLIVNRMKNRMESKNEFN